MSRLTKTFRVDAVLTDMTSVTLSDSTATYGVKRNDTDAVVVADGTAMTKSSTGIYTHTFSDPADDLTYTYALEIVYLGETYHITDTFSGPVATTAMFTLTTSEIKARIETLFVRLAGRVCLHNERDLIEDAVNIALIDMCYDYGVDRIKLMKKELTVDTVANQEYVDIICPGTATYSILNVVDGTVRIVASNARLSVSDVEAIYSTDPGKEVKGMPSIYAPTRIHGTAEGMRLYLWPVPDAAYTINYDASVIVDEDSISDFPTFLIPALKDKATEVALRELGFLNESVAYAISYNNRLSDIATIGNTDAPLHIPRRGSVHSSNLQSRTN